MIDDGRATPGPRGGRGTGVPSVPRGGGTSPRSSRPRGLKPVCRAYGILGFVRFLDCYYLTLITRRAKVGSIGGNSIYTIKSTETFPLKPAERDSGHDGGDDGADPGGVLLSMWNRGKRSVGLGLSNREIAELRYQGLYQVVDLAKNFFFSYTYDLTRSLQENFLAMTSRPVPPAPYKDMYAWNHFLTRELEECGSGHTAHPSSGGGPATPGNAYHWVLPVVHGAFIQRKLHDYGRSLNLVLLARRSRHFAGTRYLKRGVSDRGKVANDVEHEQVIHDETTGDGGVFSSYLQIRGSIPTFWTQESSVTMPKPPIVLNRVDPTYQATQAHFDDLLRRYGSPIIVVDLVKQSEKREREVIVGNEFRMVFPILTNRLFDPRGNIGTPSTTSTATSTTVTRYSTAPSTTATSASTATSTCRAASTTSRPGASTAPVSSAASPSGRSRRGAGSSRSTPVRRPPGERTGGRHDGRPVEEARRPPLLPDGADGHTAHELHRVSFFFLLHRFPRAGVDAPRARDFRTSISLELSPSQPHPPNQLPRQDERRPVQRGSRGARPAARGHGDTVVAASRPVVHHSQDAHRHVRRDRRPDRIAVRRVRGAQEGRVGDERGVERARSAGEGEAAVPKPLASSRLAGILVLCQALSHCPLRPLRPLSAQGAADVHQAVLQQCLHGSAEAGRDESLPRLLVSRVSTIRRCVGDMSGSFRRCLLHLTDPLKYRGARQRLLPSQFPRQRRSEVSLQSMKAYQN
ncbi:hypothetical protein THAOC_34153, partial [Thalassiosira oceanica]